MEAGQCPPHHTHARSVARHQRAVREMLSPLAARPPVAMPLEHASGRVLAADVFSPIDLPVFRNSQMDGYAVAAASITAVPTTLEVTDVVPAGRTGPPGRLGSRQAIKVMTGAPVPPGADCVVPVEDTEQTPGTVVVLRGRQAGEFIREAGSDLRAGAVLLPAGMLLGPHHIAAFAAAGLTSVPVRPLVTAAVITTGDELAPRGSALLPGQIYDSNGIALAAALAAAGATAGPVATSTDDAQGFHELLSAATDQADVVLTSGGVSMGDFEVVRAVLSPLGGEFGHVAMQPGGPQGLSVIGGVPVLSFPGNPVSTLVSFIVFARPVLRELAGLPPTGALTARLAAPVRSPAGRRQYLRGHQDGADVTPLPGAGSHLIASMARATVLIDIPSGVTQLPAGADVEVLPL